MMKKPTVRKLKIAPETIRTLETTELSRVGGGALTFGAWCRAVDLTLSGAPCDAYSKLAC